MPYIVKLKIGFFKTQPYRLTVRKQQIILIPKGNNKLPWIVLNGEDISAIMVIRNHAAVWEIEIVTSDWMYRGTLATETNIKGLFSALTKEFERKLIIM